MSASTITFFIIMITGSVTALKLHSRKVYNILTIKNLSGKLVQYLL